MTKTLQSISPIDGSVFAERPVLTFEAAQAASDKARTAQGAGRIAELPEPCRMTGIISPLLVTNKGLKNMDITA
jgi:acyl-CoA reductase-like NAD-dependent aldehyde dehydrogenase